jgi:cathepsin B
MKSDDSENSKKKFFLNIFLILLISIICIIFFNIIRKHEYFLGFVGVVPVVFDDRRRRQAKVSLAALRADFKMNDISILIPSFILYDPSYLIDIEEQGECGACWAFATCNVLADKISALSNGKIKNKLSVQELVQCVDKYKECKGCDGGHPESAAEWLVENKHFLSPISDGGLEYELDRTRVVVPTCPNKNSNIGIGIKNNSIKSITKFIPEKDYDGKILEDNIINMKAELILNGPFFCAITIYDDFYTYDGNKVYESDKKKLIGGHAIEVIGYCDKNINNIPGFERGHWICKNSWGTKWPTKSKKAGYFAVAMGNNECGIESRCGSFEPILKQGEYKADHKLSTYIDFVSFKNDTNRILF